jgi:tetratricopeptide (TPR) repeat protein
MRRFLILVVILGALIVIAPSASFAQTGKDFRAASGTFIEQGYAALKLEKNWAALELFEKAVVANPHSLSAYIGLGKVHEALGSISGGLKYYAIAIELDPRHLAAWEAKISAHLVISELVKAQEALSRIRAVCGEESCLEAIRAKAAIDAYQAKSVATAKKP